MSDEVSKAETSRVPADSFLLFTLEDVEGTLHYFNFVLKSKKSVSIWISVIASFSVDGDNDQILAKDEDIMRKLGNYFQDLFNDLNLSMWEKNLEDFEGPQQLDNEHPCMTIDKEEVKLAQKGMGRGKEKEIETYTWCLLT